MSLQPLVFRRIIEHQRLANPGARQQWPTRERISGPLRPRVLQRIQHFITFTNAQMRCRRSAPTTRPDTAQPGICAATLRVPGNPVRSASARADNRLAAPRAGSVHRPGNWQTMGDSARVVPIQSGNFAKIAGATGHRAPHRAAQQRLGAGGRGVLRSFPGMPLHIQPLPLSEGTGGVMIARREPLQLDTLDLADQQHVGQSTDQCEHRDISIRGTNESPLARKRSSAGDHEVADEVDTRRLIEQPCWRQCRNQRPGDRARPYRRTPAPEEGVQRRRLQRDWRR